MSISQHYIANRPSLSRKLSHIDYNWSMCPFHSSLKLNSVLDTKWQKYDVGFAENKVRFLDLTSTFLGESEKIMFPLALRFSILACLLICHEELTSSGMVSMTVVMAGRLVKRLPIQIVPGGLVAKDAEVTAPV